MRPPRFDVDRLPSGWTLDRGQAELDRLHPLRLTTRTRPTSGALVALGAAGCLQLLDRVDAGRWLALGAAACIALLLTAVLLRPRLDDVTVVRRLDSRGAVGDLVQTTLVVTNDGGRRTPAMVAVDELPAHQTLRIEVPSLAPGASVSVRTLREVRARGRHLGGVVRIGASSPIGLVTARRDVPLTADVVSHPAPADRTPGRPGGLRPGPGSGSSRPAAGAGTEVLGLRPWRPGDASRAVSPRASARHGRPLVLEREREQHPALVVLVAGGGSGPAWELLLSRAAALTVSAVRSGDPVVLLGPPCPQRPNPVQVLDAFAAADWAEPLGEPGVRSAIAVAGRGGTIVLVAPPGAPAERAAALLVTAAGCRLVVLDA